MSGMNFNYCDISLCVVAICTANRIEEQKGCTFNPGSAENYEKRCIHCRTNLQQTGINGKSYFHCDNYDAQEDARKKAVKHPNKEKKDIEKPKTEKKPANHNIKRKNKQKQKNRTKAKPLRSQSDIIQEKLKKMTNK